MKKNIIACVASLVAALMVANCLPAMADVLGVESWSNCTLQGWSCLDTVNESTVQGLDARNGFLDVAFAGQTMKMPPLEYMLKADASASSGLFAGNYLSNGVQSLSFRVFCEYESIVCAVIHGGGKFWRYQVPTLPTGIWASVTVPVSPSMLKSLCATNNAEEFSQALESVDWVGVTFLRNNTLNAYHCGIDDVTLCGAGVGYGSWIKQFAGSAKDKLPGADLDANGIDNYSEWVAGAVPGDNGTTFSLKSVTPVQDGAGGFTLQWRSVSGRQYQVWRTESLASGFASITDWIPATPPSNTYIDESAAGFGQCYYKLKVKKVE